MTKHHNKGRQNMTKHHNKGRQNITIKVDKTSRQNITIKVDKTVQVKHTIPLKGRSAKHHVLERQNIDSVTWNTN